MKKLLFILTAAFGLMIGAASASAAVQYPPNGATPTVSGPQTVKAGEMVTYTVFNAQPGEKVTLTVDGMTYEAVADANGVVTFTFTAPSKTGTYPIQVHLASSGIDLISSLTVVGANVPTTAKPVPSGKLPATGSSGTTQGVVFAGALLSAGAGLVFVAKRRNAVA